MKKRKAYVVMIREATQDRHEVYEHDEDLIAKDKNRCWVRTSDPLISENGNRYYYAIATEPRTIPIGKGKAVEGAKGKGNPHKKFKTGNWDFMGGTLQIPIWELTKEERDSFGNYSTEKINAYHDYRFLDQLKKKITRGLSEIFFIVMTGLSFGLLLHILLGAMGM